MTRQSHHRKPVARRGPSAFTHSAVRRR